MKLLAPIVLLFATTIFAQDYGPKAIDKEATVRMHFAIKLFRGEYGKQQEDFLLKAIHNRRLVNEIEASKLFSRDDLRDIFFGIGHENISTFRQMYEKPTIAEKKDIWHRLLPDEKVDARRVNLAWGIGTLKLTEIQIEFLLRFSKKLPTITKDEAEIFETEALALFSKETGRMLFGSIGPYSCTSSLQPANCQCSVGSSFNMSCDGECSAGGSSCTTTGDGCGFAWLYSCNGRCAAN